MPRRILIAKPGLDGHDRGAKVIARALRDAGFEVIYSGLHQTPAQIAEAAVQEDVDAVGLSSLSGAHKTLFPQVVEELAARDAPDIVVFGGGVIPEADFQGLYDAGLATIFTPGTPLDQITAWVEANIPSKVQERELKVHEYQAKQIMASRGIPVPLGRMATTVDEAVEAVRPIIEESGNPVVVLKSQIHAGGRGRGTFAEHPDLRGVNVITDGIEGGPEAAEAKVRQLAAKMLGSTLVTIQTGPEGKVVNRLYLEQGIDIARELYLAVLLDRSVGRNIVMASTEGGMEIEKVAAEAPEKILRQEIDPAIGLADFQANELAHGLEIEGDAAKSFARFVKSLDRAGTELDTDFIEINPLVITGDGVVMALDGKMAFDDNALFRHPDIAAMRDETEEDPAEVAAKEAGLNYIKLDGTIGCLANGAGLAMATMDTIQHVGGEPANFLDVGGGADEQQVTTAFQIITKDPAVKGIFVNIFGGIMRCDVIATGIVAAVKTVGLSVPLVVRLEGTNVEQGKKILNESGLDLVAADSLRDGAEKIVGLVA